MTIDGVDTIDDFDTFDIVDDVDTFDTVDDIDNTMETVGYGAFSKSWVITSTRVSV